MISSLRVLKHGSIIWVTSSKKVPSSMRNMCRFISCICTMSHPGNCYPLKHFMVSSDFVADSEGPDQTGQMRRLICAFAVRICPKTHFCMALPILWSWTKLSWSNLFFILLALTLAFSSISDYQKCETCSYLTWHIISSLHGLKHCSIILWPRPIFNGLMTLTFFFFCISPSIISISD